MLETTVFIAFTALAIAYTAATAYLKLHRRAKNKKRRQQTIPIQFWGQHYK